MPDTPASLIVEELFKSTINKHELVGEGADHKHEEITADDVPVEYGMDGDNDRAEETSDSSKLEVPDVKVDDNLDLAHATPAKRVAKDATPASTPKADITTAKAPDNLKPKAAKAPAPAAAAKAPAAPAAESPTPEPPVNPEGDGGDGQEKKKNPFAKSTFAAVLAEGGDIPEEKAWSSGWIGPDSDVTRHARALRFHDVRATPGMSSRGLASLLIHSDDLSRAQSLAASAGVPARWVKSMAGDAVGGEFKEMEDALDTDDDDEEGEVEPDEDDVLAVGSPRDGLVVMQYPDGSLSGQLSAGDEAVGRQLEAERRRGLFANKSKPKKDKEEADEGSPEEEASESPAEERREVEEGDEPEMAKSTADFVADAYKATTDPKALEGEEKSGTSEGAKKGWEGRKGLHAAVSEAREHVDKLGMMNWGPLKADKKRRLSELHAVIISHPDMPKEHKVKIRAAYDKFNKPGHKNQTKALDEYASALSGAHSSIQNHDYAASFRNSHRKSEAEPVEKHMPDVRCPECGAEQHTHVGRGTHKCDKCGAEFKPHEMETEKSGTSEGARKGWEKRAKYKHVEMGNPWTRPSKTSAQVDKEESEQGERMKTYAGPLGQNPTNESTYGKAIKLASNRLVDPEQAHEHFHHMVDLAAHLDPSKSLDEHAANAMSSLLYYSGYHGDKHQSKQNNPAVRIRKVYGPLFEDQH